MLTYNDNIINIIIIVTCITDYRQVLDWMTGFIDILYIHTTRDYRQLQRYGYKAIAILHTFSSTLHTH
jgi:hypothetical protein